MVGSEFRLELGVIIDRIRAGRWDMNSVYVPTKIELQGCVLLCVCSCTCHILIPIILILVKTFWENEHVLAGPQDLQSWKVQT